MSNRFEQQEKLFLSLIQWMIQIPNLDIVIADLSEKQTYQSTKISVSAGMHSFEMTDKNAEVFDVVVDGKKLTVISQDVVKELHYIKRYLIEYHRKNYIKDINGKYIKIPQTQPQRILFGVFDKSRKR